MPWLNNIVKWLKNLFNLISRVIKLEERVSILEKKIEVVQKPPKDIKENLEYKKEWNYYIDKVGGEEFCPVCIGNGKRITISWSKNSQIEGWYCQNCKAQQFKNKSKPSSFQDQPYY